MRKFLFAKHFPSLSILIAFLACIGIILQFRTTPPNAHAQSYSSINCPTSTEKNTLQMIPCTGTSTISNTPVPQQNSNTSPTNPIKTPVNQKPNSPFVPPTNQNSPTTKLKFPTPAVKPAGPACTPDTVKNPNVTCSCPANEERDTVCTVPNDADCNNAGGYPMYAGSGTSNTGGNVHKCFWLWTVKVNKAAAHATGCQMECNSKPVLYFYSPTKLSINVLLDIPGFVTASIPNYPATGWQNVIVHPDGTPDGTLAYDNKYYNELYYEDETIKAQAPNRGFVIPTADLESSLKTYTTKLGLNPSEQNEFIAYWVPRLTDLHAPYIFFSVFDQTQKEKVDHVIVTPAPQTTIAFLAYFKPLEQPVKVAPLQFPAVPKRQGFTMVEWGGTIDGTK